MCYVLFTVVCLIIFIKWHLASMSLTCSVSGCVFLPALALLRVGMHTVCALLVWERSTFVFVCQCGRSALGERSLRRALSPAFPAVRVPPLPRQSGDLNRGDRRWIWQKDWRRARPFLFLCSRSPPPRRGLPFFPDLHTEVSRSWRKPYSACLFSPCVSHYSNVLGLNECGYGKIP